MWQVFMAHACSTAFCWADRYHVYICNSMYIYKTHKYFRTPSLFKPLGAGVYCWGGWPTLCSCTPGTYLVVSCIYSGTAPFWTLPGYAVESYKIHLYTNKQSKNCTNLMNEPQLRMHAHDRETLTTFTYVKDRPKSGQAMACLSQWPLCTDLTIILTYMADWVRPKRAELFTSCLC